MTFERNKISKNPWKLFKSVLPQHTDHAGVMWHGAYLNWLEEARIQALSEVGIQYKELSDLGFEMPVVSLEIQYKNSLFHGQDVVLESLCLPRVKSKYPWSTSFLRDKVIIAEAMINLVLVKKMGNQFKLTREVPDFLSAGLDKLIIGPAEV